MDGMAVVFRAREETSLLGETYRKGEEVRLLLPHDWDPTLEPANESPREANPSGTHPWEGVGPFEGFPFPAWRLENEALGFV